MAHNPLRLVNARLAKNGKQADLDRRVLLFFCALDLLAVAGSLLVHFLLDPFDDPRRFWLMLSTVLVPAFLLVWKSRRPAADLRYPIAVGVLAVANLFNYATRLPDFFAAFYLALLGVALYRDLRLYTAASALALASMLVMDGLGVHDLALALQSPLVNTVIRWMVFTIFSFILFHMVWLLVRREREFFRCTYGDTVQAFAQAVETKDRYTRGHAERTTAYALLLGAELRREGYLGEDDLQVLWMAGLLHDIGKIGVPDGILLKEGRLDAAEYRRIKEHPALGETILAELPFLRPVLPVVRHHHERYDGTGYPDGLRGGGDPVAGAGAGGGGRLRRHDQPPHLPARPATGAGLAGSDGKQR